MCMSKSLPRCGAKAAAPSAPILLSAHTTKHTHITNQESTRPQTTPQRHNQCIPERPNVCMFNSLPRCGAKASTPSSPILLSAHTTKHTHITNHESTRPQTTPQRHNPRVLARDSACIFNSLPRCGAKAAAPSALMLFPAHATIHTHHTNHESQHVHKLHHSATTRAYLQGTARASLTAFPDVEPKLRLPRHRCCSLLTQQYTRTTRITNLNTSTNHTTAPQPMLTSQAQRVHVQQLAQVWSQSCRSLITDCVLCSHNQAHAHHESRINTSTNHTTAPQPVRTFKVQRAHVQQLAQVWSQSCRSLVTDVVACSHNQTHAHHESGINTSTNHTTAPGTTCACSTACPGVEPKLPLPRH